MFGPSNILVIEELYFDLQGGGDYIMDFVQTFSDATGPSSRSPPLTSIASLFAYKVRVAHTTLVDITRYFYIFV